MSESLVLNDQTRPGVAELILNRPERRNALSIALMNDLVSALEKLSADSINRVLIIRANGPAFCSGLDLDEAADPGLAETAADGVRRLFIALARTPLVTIAAAHGFATAGGAGLMVACDFAVAAEDLRVGFPEVRRGLVPALVATILRKKLRDADLLELFLLAELIDTTRARSMGLVSSVVPADTIRAEAERIASLILKGGPQAIRSTKALLSEFDAVADSEAIHMALQHHLSSRISEEAQEGLAAFLEKREPNWA